MSEFLTTKARNFKAYILQYGPDATVTTWLAAFDESQLVPTILSTLAPIHQLGGLSYTADQLITHLSVPEMEHQAVRDKLQRYLTMFVEVATTKKVIG